MSTLEEQYPFTTAEDSVVYKDWACGSSEQLDSTEFLIRKVGQKYVGSYESIKFPPALWKIIDEPIVNALDHLVRCLGTPNPVTVIKVSIDNTGRIRIYNNGPGINTGFHKTASEKLGREIRLPTLIFGELFQGSNRNQSDDSIIGGTNGLGAKLSNCFSVEFAVETVHDNTYFLQKWSNHKSVVNEPTIIDLTGKNNIPADRSCPHTLLSFLPDYVGLFKYDSYDQRLHHLITDLIRTRTILAAVYAKYTAGSQVNVWFNDEKINLGMTDLADIFFPGKPKFATTIIPEVDPKARSRIHYKYAWEIVAVVTDASKCNQLSVVNGVVVRHGKHYQHIMSKIIDNVQDKIAKIVKDKNIKFSRDQVSKNVFLFMNTKIPKPSWTGQRKDVLDVNIKKLSGYTLTNNFTDPIAEKLKGQILDSLCEQTTSISTAIKTQNVDYDKYEPARLCNSKKALKCGLIAVEGDSAITTLKIGVSNVLGFDYYGIISLGGVIMNARKECKIVKTPNGSYIKKTKRLINNLFMNVITSVTGLNTSYKYDPNSKTFNKEMSELHYGFIVACVDQDLDGKGFILGLLLSTFELFWPNLLAAGYIKWFCSPIIRAYPKNGGIVECFYTVNDYKNWTKKINSDKYNIFYYKGLGSHDRDEVVHMFKSFHQNLFTYFVDERTHKLFEVYFGSDPDLRKQELRKPISDIPDNKLLAQQRSKQISCSDHLEFETNLFQKDNLERKLDHVIDGQNQAGRKILDGLMKALGGTKRMKVSQLSGFISEKENYHHGEDSLNKSITNRGFIATGGKQLPIIIPLSQFGTRLEGGDDAASPRYIYAKLNENITKLIFPDQDYCLLQFNFDEGVRGEPRYFVPIIPMAIIESTEIPAHGWKLKLWGRDVFSVIRNVRRLIMLGDDVKLIRTPPTTYKGGPHEWTGTFKTIRGEQYSFGKYELMENKIIITELPLRVWTKPYIKILKKKEKDIIESIYDESSDLNVRIIVNLKPGAINVLSDMGDAHWTDGIEEYFQLRNRMDSHINLMGVDGEVIEFDDYEQVITKWFPVRKEFYCRRIARELILLKLSKCKYSNMVRYIEESEEMKLVKRKKSDMINLLIERKFDKIYQGRLSNPKFTPTEDLEEIILRGSKSSYDYLLGLSDVQKSSESLQNFRDTLHQLESKIIDLQNISEIGRFPGSAIWEKELDCLEEKIKEGIKTDWKYNDAGKFILA